MNRNWLFFFAIALLVVDSLADPVRSKDTSSQGHSEERRHRGKGLKLGHVRSEDETTLDEASDVAAEAVGTAVDQEVEAEALQTALEQTETETTDEEKQERVETSEPEDEAQPLLPPTGGALDGPPPMTLEIKFEDVPPPAPINEEQGEPLLHEFLLASNSGDGSGSGFSDDAEVAIAPHALGATMQQVAENVQPEVQLEDVQTEELAVEHADPVADDEGDEEEEEDEEEGEAEAEGDSSDENDENVEEELANFHFLVDPNHLEAAANNVVDEAQEISQHIVNDENAETEQVANLALNEVVEHVNDVNHVNEDSHVIADVFSNDADESDEEAEKDETDFLENAPAKSEDVHFDNEMNEFIAQMNVVPAHEAEPVANHVATNQVPVNVVNNAINELNKVSDDVRKVVSDLNGAIEKVAADQAEAAQPTHAKFKRDTAYTSRLLHQLLEKRNIDQEKVVSRLHDMNKKKKLMRRL